MTKNTPTAVCSTVNPSTSINVDSLLCDADALALTISDMVQASASIAMGVQRALSLSIPAGSASHDLGDIACALTLSELSNLLPLLTNTAVTGGTLARDNRDAVSTLSTRTELTTPNTKENTHD